MSTFSVILIALITLLIGIALGAALWRKLGTQSQSRELEEKLKEAEQRLSLYQAEVAEHFLETSRRVNELTRNYKEVHEYLASSAMRLTTPALGHEIQVAAQISWPEEAEGEQPTPKVGEPVEKNAQAEPAMEKDTSRDQL